MKARPLSLVCRVLGAALLVACAITAACGAPDTNARVDPIGPDRASFTRPYGVADMLISRCGSLDCHGSEYRNLRLYGKGGLRLPDPNPNSARHPDTDTAADERDKDYDAVIGVEPEIMRDVVRDRGAHPERLTLVRKPRGTEDHKGKTVIALGDDADTCLLSWLASATDTAACKRAVDAWVLDGGGPSGDLGSKDASVVSP
jgi:hypothetical protein